MLCQFCCQDSNITDVVLHMLLNQLSREGNEIKSLFFLNIALVLSWQQTDPFNPSALKP